MKVHFKTRNKDFGIITWSYTQDEQIKELFGNSDYINIQFEEKKYYNKKVSYKYRRFSFPKKKLQQYKHCNFIKLSKIDDSIKLTFLK